MEIPHIERQSLYWKRLIGVTDCMCDTPKGPAASCGAGWWSKFFPLKTVELNVSPAAQNFMNHIYIYILVWNKHNFRIVYFPSNSTIHCIKFQYLAQHSEIINIHLEKLSMCCHFTVCSCGTSRWWSGGQFPHVLLITYIKPYIIEMNTSVPAPFKVENMVCMHNKR